MDNLEDTQPQPVRLGSSMPTKALRPESPSQDYLDKLEAKYPMTPTTSTADSSGGTSTMSRLGDVGITLAKSAAIGVPETILGLADIPTGGRAGKLAEEAGYSPKGIREYLDPMYSPAQQEAKKAVSEAKGFGDTLRAYGEHPSELFHNVLEQGVPLLLGGAIGKGLGAATKLPAWAAGAAGETAITAGQNAEGVRQQTPGGLLDTFSQTLPILGSAALTGGISAGFGKVANQLGIGDVNTALAGGGLGTGNITKRLIGAGVLGGAEEGLQSPQEQMAQNYALNKPLMEGVDKATAQGLALGTVMGHGVGGLDVLSGKDTDGNKLKITTFNDGTPIHTSGVSSALSGYMDAYTTNMASPSPIYNDHYEAAKADLNKIITSDTTTNEDGTTTSGAKALEAKRALVDIDTGHEQVLNHEALLAKGKEDEQVGSEKAKEIVTKSVMDKAKAALDKSRGITEDQVGTDEDAGVKAAIAAEEAAKSTEAVKSTESPWAISTKDHPSFRETTKEDIDKFVKSGLDGSLDLTDPHVPVFYQNHKEEIDAKEAEIKSVEADTPVEAGTPVEADTPVEQSQEFIPTHILNHVASERFPNRPLEASIPLQEVPAKDPTDLFEAATYIDQQGNLHYSTTNNDIKPITQEQAGTPVESKVNPAPLTDPIKIKRAEELKASIETSQSIIDSKFSNNRDKSEATQDMAADQEELDSLGTPVEASTPAEATTINNTDGKPFRSKQIASDYSKSNGLEETHEAVRTGNLQEWSLEPIEESKKVEAKKGEEAPTSSLITMNDHGREFKTKIAAMMHSAHVGLDETHEAVELAPGKWALKPIASEATTVSETKEVEAKTPKKVEAKKVVKAKKAVVAKEASAVSPYSSLTEDDALPITTLFIRAVVESKKGTSSKAIAAKNEMAIGFYDKLVAGKPKSPQEVKDLFFTSLQEFIAANEHNLGNLKANYGEIVQNLVIPQLTLKELAIKKEGTIKSLSTKAAAKPKVPKIVVEGGQTVYLDLNDLEAKKVKGIDLLKSKLSSEVFGRAPVIIQGTGLGNTLRGDVTYLNTDGSPQTITLSFGRSYIKGVEGKLETKIIADKVDVAPPNPVHEALVKTDTSSLDEENEEDDKLDKMISELPVEIAATSSLSPDSKQELKDIKRDIASINDEIKLLKEDNEDYSDLKEDLDRLIARREVLDPKDPNRTIGTKSKGHNESGDTSDYTIQTDSSNESTFANSNGDVVSLLYDLGDINLSEESNITHDESRKLVDTLQKITTSLVDIHYVESWNDLEGTNIEKPADNVKGIHISPIIQGMNTTIILNGALLNTREKLLGTFAHETIGHYGVRALFQATVDNQVKFENFMLNLLNNTKEMRNSIIKNGAGWKGYLDAWKKLYVPNYSELSWMDQERAYLAHLDSLEALNTGSKLGFVNENGITIYLPRAIAINFADEFVAEKAKALFLSKGFLDKSVGLGLNDIQRKSLSEKRSDWFNGFLTKLKHLFKSVFGDLFNHVTNDDLTELLAMSTSSLFSNVNPEYKPSSVNPIDSKTISIGTVNDSDDVNYDVEISDQTRAAKKKRQRLFNKKEADLAYSKLTQAQKNKIAADEKAKEDYALLTQERDAARAAEISRYNVLDTEGSYAINESIGASMWKSFDKWITNSPTFNVLKVLGNLPQQKALYSIIQRGTGLVNQAENKALTVGKVLSSINPIQNYAINEYMTTVGASVDDLPLNPLQKKIVKDAKDTIEEYGDLLVSVGALDYTSYMENKGKYLHITYLEYINKNKGSGYKVSFQSYLKSRGEKTEAERMMLGEIKDVQYTIPQTLGVMMRDFHLLNMFKEISMFSGDMKAYWVIDSKKMIPNPLNRRRTMTLTDAVEQLDQMDTMNIANQQLLKGVLDQTKNEALNKSLEVADRLRSDIDNSIDVTLTEAFEHAKSQGTTSSTTKADFLKDHYSQMPNTARYGQLRKMWVRKEISDDLNDLTNPYEVAGKKGIDKWFARGGTLERLNTYWKQSMTTLNPAFWPRAFLGNFYLLDTTRSTNKATLMKDLFDEVSGHLNNQDSYWWNMATKYGQFGSTMGAVELNNMQQEFGSKLLAAKRAKELRGQGSKLDEALHFLDERMMVMGSMMNNATQSTFSMMEGMFKTVAFKDYVRTWEKQNGIDHKTLDSVQMDVLFSNAAKDASDAIFDYSQVHHTIKTLRRIPLGDPFITFTYKVIPATLKSAVTHPIKLAQYLALPSLLTMAAMSMNDWDDDDLKGFKRSMSDAQRQNAGTFLMPFKDSLGRVQTISLDPVLGYSIVTNTSRHIYQKFVDDSGESPVSTTALALHEASQDLGVLGGPVPKIISAFLTGKDGFTGKDIMNKGESASNQIFDMMKYMGNMVAPNFLSGHGFAGKMIDALGIDAKGPAMTKQGEQKVTPGQAASSLTGFGATPILPKTGLENRKIKFEMELKDISSLRNKIATDRNIPSENRAARLKDVTERMKNTRMRMQEALR